MAGGWIKLWWCLKKSLVGSSALSSGIWMHLLLRASHRRVILRSGETLERGQLIIAERSFAEDLGVSRKVMRRHLDLFESEAMIVVIDRGRRGTKIQIVNWDRYQSAGIEDHKRDQPSGSVNGTYVSSCDTEIESEGPNTGPERARIDTNPDQRRNHSEPQREIPRGLEPDASRVGSRATKDLSSGKLEMASRLKDRIYDKMYRFAAAPDASKRDAELVAKLAILAATDFGEGWLADLVEAVAATKPQNPWAYLQECAKNNTWDKYRADLYQLFARLGSPPPDLLAQPCTDLRERCCVDTPMEVA